MLMQHRSRVLAAFLLVYVLPSSLAATQQIGGERLPSEPAYGGALATTAIASDGDGFLAASTIARSGWPAARATYLSRITRSGAVLDPTGIRLSGISADTMVWNGSEYVLFWSEVAPNGGFTNHYVARVGRDGNVIEGPRPVAFAPRTASSNGRIIIVSLFSSIAILDRNANLLEARPVVCDAVVPNGSGFVLVKSGSGSSLTALDADGRVVAGPAPVSLTSIDTAACNGSGCIALQGFSVEAFDANLKSIKRSALMPDAGYTVSSAAADGGDYVVTAAGRLLRLDANGDPVAAPVLLSPPGRTSVISNGHEVAILTESDVKVFISMLPHGAGAPRQAAPVFRSANGQLLPGIGFSGTNYLAAWLEFGYDLYAARMSLDGDPLDGRGILLGRCGSGYSSINPPSVAFSRGSYFVACVNSNSADMSLEIVRIDAQSGAIAARATIPSVACGDELLNQVRLASNGSVTLALWPDCKHRLLAAYVDDAAQLERTPTVIDVQSDPLLRAGHPSAAWNGSEWLIAWEQQFKVSGPQPYEDFFAAHDVKAARYSASLAPLDTDPLLLSNGQSSFRWEGQPHVATSGDEFLVVWSYFDSANVAQVRARHVGANGTVLDTAPIVVASGNAQDAVWDGSRYAVAYGTAIGFEILTDALLTWVGTAGAPPATESAVINATPTVESTAALAVIGTGRVAAIYEREAAEPQFGGVHRVFIAVPGAPPATVPMPSAPPGPRARAVGKP